MNKFIIPFVAILLIVFITFFLFKAKTKNPKNSSKHFVIYEWQIYPNYLENGQTSETGQYLAAGILINGKSFGNINKPDLIDKDFVPVFLVISDFELPWRIITSKTSTETTEKISYKSLNSGASGHSLDQIEEPIIELMDKKIKIPIKLSTYENLNSWPKVTEYNVFVVNEKMLLKRLSLIIDTKEQYYKVIEIANGKYKNKLEAIEKILNKSN